jgi:hypothetical protein
MENVEALPTQSPPGPIGNLDPNTSDDHPSVMNPSPQEVSETLQNSFGLFRRYHSRQVPSYDPECEANISSLSDIIPPHTKSLTLPTYGPYPNKSSFRLGEWYWNDGIQKSQTSFQELVSIIGDVDFQPTDIRSTNWGKINDKLAGVADEEEWLDEDPGWTTSSVTISAPFHRFTSNPGSQDYMVTNFHHRPLVPIIREKLANVAHGRHFHYDPYNLLWQTANKQEPMHVHGELYTSPAFQEAHQALQNSPSEPGCNLPRVIVALMFWSDSTHLTNFGDTKLWPLYMFFGNESKYQ